MSQAENAVLSFREPSQPDRLEIREQAERTAAVVAAGDESSLRRAMESVAWERLGRLGRLVRRAP